MKILPTWLALVAVAVIALGIAGWKSWRVASFTMEAVAHGNTLLVAASNSRGAESLARLAGIAPELQAEADALDALQRELGPLPRVLHLTASLPARVSWLAQVPDLLDAAVPLARFGAATAMAAADLPPDAGGGLAAQLASLDRLTPQTPHLLELLDAADHSVKSLAGKPLRGPLERIGPVLTRVAALLPAARAWLELVPRLGPALGTQGPRSYLLLTQNNRELRATGGFVGTAGVITFDGGQMTSLDYGSSYLIDPAVQAPAPPLPLARYMGLTGWYLRDANWWPDFPSTATQVEQAWRRAGKDPIDGVVAFDEVVILAVLRVVGPLSVPPYGQVDADNFDRLTAEEVYAPGGLIFTIGPDEAKRAFVGQVGASLLQRLLGASADELAAIGEQVLALLPEKHIQLAFKDQSLIGLVNRHGWGGIIPDVSEDSLFVVDTSVSYGDTRPFVETAARLEVKIDADNTQHHDLTLTYRNVFPAGAPPWLPLIRVQGSTFDPASGNVRAEVGFWGNWLRVYLPADAASVGAEGLTNGEPQYGESGRQVVAGYVPVAPGEQRTIRFNYVLPGRAGAPQRYRLFLQKQAGITCRPISIAVQWSRGASATYEACPTTDGWIELTP